MEFWEFIGQTIHHFVWFCIARDITAGLSWILLDDLVALYLVGH